MTHDPLCNAFTGRRLRPSCECDLIAEVRADEQQQVARRLTGYHAKDCIGGSSGLGCGCGLWADVVTYSVEQS
jgi:hypothetical protein